MAKVLIPQNARSYDQNPRGSATAVVTMKGHNPFDGGRRAMIEIKHPGSAIPGMSGLAGLSDDSAGATPTAASSTAAVDILSSIVGAATAVGTKLATARIDQLYPPQTTQPLSTSQAQQISTSQISTLPLGPQSTVVYPPAQSSSKLPYILVGVGLLGLGAALFLSRRKKR